MSARLRFSAVLAPLVVVCGLLAADAASAQFRNNALHGGLAWNGLDTSTFFVNQLFGANGRWVASDQPTLFAGYSRSFGDLPFTPLDDLIWLYWEGSIGAGIAPSVDGNARIILGLTGTTVGARYYFLDENHRPFVSAGMNIFWLGPTFGPDDPVPVNAFIGQAAWLGAKVGGGYEYVLTGTALGELGIGGELYAQVYTSFVDLVKLSYTPRLYANVYF